MTALAGDRTYGDTAPTRHARLLDWVREVAELTTPDRVVWCDGSEAEWDRLTAELVAAGTLVPLDPVKTPELVLGPHRPVRRGPGRGAHLHLLGRRRRTPVRPTTGWTRPR